MKLVHWTRFTWDLSKIKDPGNEVPSHYQIRPALKEEDKVVKNVILAAFSLDSEWSDIFHILRDRFLVQLDDLSEQKSLQALVLTHGSRIIGASAVDPNPEAEGHLVSGPCILQEYRNRGLGTQLLYQSLLHLKNAGLKKARGITKTNSQAAKFCYPKFQSVNEPFSFEIDSARSLQPAMD